MAQVYKVAGILAARIAGEDPAMDAAASAVADAARALAASHNVTGEYLNGIGTDRIRGKRGVTDRIAYVDHEAAASIEFGHEQGFRKGFVGPGRYVEGLHIFGQAAGRA
jgi:hypothetical protein